LIRLVTTSNDSAGDESDENSQEAATVEETKPVIDNDEDVTLTKIRTALERAGVEFIAENGGGSGVRLRKANRSQR
jgi:hypothetical protein